jgi:REP element-mobilizing transposase RayT
MPDHVHILISIPPKYSVAEVRVLEKEKLDLDCAQMGNASCAIFLATLKVGVERPFWGW